MIIGVTAFTIRRVYIGVRFKDGEEVPKKIAREYSFCAITLVRYFLFLFVSPRASPTR